MEAGERKKLVILGAGESGVGAAVLGKKMGYEVFVSDKSPIKNAYKGQLEALEIPFEENGHDEERILLADWIIKSPGIPKKAPLILKIKEKGITISSEIEFASRFTDAKIIAITGSNGKTTTTSLVYHILKSEGWKVGLAGNIGKSFAAQVANEDHDYYVLEVSSFQLDDIQEFKPHIAVLLNLSPDHLDQYNYNFEEYALAKFRITENQTQENFFIFNKDDEMSLQLLKKVQIQSEHVPFSVHTQLSFGGYLEDHKLKLHVHGDFEIEEADLGIQGIHNVSNSLAASLAGKLLNIRNENIREALKTFQPVEHRMEKCRELDGVSYINDSKATNVNAVYYALDSMKTPVVWIVGGVDKGNDYTELDALVKKKVTTIICLGIDNEKLLEHYGSFGREMAEAGSMEEAVRLANAHAKKGDTVLLSPACASFDLFENYEDRGRKFKEAVNLL